MVPDLKLLTVSRLSIFCCPASINSTFKTSKIHVSQWQALNSGGRVAINRRKQSFGSRICFIKIRGEVFQKTLPVVEEDERLLEMEASGEAEDSEQRDESGEDDGHEAVQEGEGNHEGG